MMRHWREREFEREARAGGLRAMAWRSGRSSRGGRALYRLAAGGSRRASSDAIGAASAAASARCRSPAAGRTGRDMPAPEGRTFMSLWAARQKRHRR